MIASSRHVSSNSAGMPATSLEARVAAIEAQLAGKTLETHFREQAELFDRRFAESFREQAEVIDQRLAHDFREQAELIDRLFTYRFEEFDKKWEGKLAAGLAGLEQRIDTKLERRLEPLRTELGRLTDAVLALVARLP